MWHEHRHDGQQRIVSLARSGGTATWERNHSALHRPLPGQGRGHSVSRETLQKSKAASNAINLLGGIIALLEGGTTRGCEAAAGRIINICKREQLRQLKIMDAADAKLGYPYPLRGTAHCEHQDEEPAPDLPGLDWVIVGGESGPDARLMHPDWVRTAASA